MYKISEILNVLEDFAPLSLSQKMIDRGDYDNSGVLINCHNNIKKVLFSLDLSKESVKRAKRLGCDTIITHHPAIYMPIKSLSGEDVVSAPVLSAIKNGMNVISMHLNLDIAKGGIDQALSEALGAKNAKVLDVVDGELGYGREFCLESQTLKQFTQKLKESLKTKRIIIYGSLNAQINSVASFCGGGSSHAQQMVNGGKTSAEVIVTSDMPHHVIKDLVENGKAVIIITHYASENYGFYKFFEKVSSRLNGAQTFYFEDKRFL